MPTLDFDIRVRFSDFELGLAQAFPLDGVIAVFGPSGSGKSTLLRSLCGLERGAQGRIAFDGEPWLDSAQRVRRAVHRRGAAYVFQDARLLPFLDVEGNLRFADRRARDEGVGSAFEAVVAAFDLAELMPRAPGTLSGGERQRVAIARALLSRPRLLLMDEPLSANDIRRKAELLPYIRQLPTGFGVPVVYVSHALDEVSFLADRVMVIERGQQVAFGPAEAVLERLDLADVTGRFEAGAVLSGRVLRHDPAYHLSYVDLGGQELVLPQVDSPPGEVVRLHVRARDVALALQPPRQTSIRNQLRGTLVGLVQEADSAFAEALIDIGVAHLRSRLTRASVVDLGLRPGREVYALVRSVTVDNRLRT